MEPINLLQIAIKNNIGVYYFSMLIPIHVLFANDAGAGAFGSRWGDFGLSSQQFSIQGVGTGQDLAGKLRRNGIAVVQQPNPTVRSWLRWNG